LVSLKKSQNTLSINMNYQRKLCRWWFRASQQRIRAHSQLRWIARPMCTVN